MSAERERSRATGGRTTVSDRGAGGPAEVTLGYLGLGSNVGDRRANLEAAVTRLPAHGVRVLASSSVYETEPVGLVLDQREFFNACRADRDRARPRSAARCVQGGRGRARPCSRRGPARAARDRRRRAAAGLARAPLGPAHRSRTAISSRGGSCSSRCSSWIRTWRSRTASGSPMPWRDWVPARRSGEPARRCSDPSPAAVTRLLCRRA